MSASMTASGAMRLAAFDEQLPGADVGDERVVAEAQLERVLEPVGELGAEQRLQGEDVRVEAHADAVGRAGRAGAPAAEREQDLVQLVAPVGELVDLGGGRGRELALADHAGLLELLQALREHVRAGVGQAGPQIGEALGPEHQLADHHQRPALADPVERAGDPACLLIRASRCHESQYSANKSYFLNF